MKSIYTLPLFAAVASAEFMPNFVTKSEAEIHQFTSFEAVSDCLDNGNVLFYCV